MGRATEGNRIGMGRAKGRVMVDLGALKKRFKHRGFVGPKYKGILGKLKLLRQEWFGHYEFVSCAEPHDWAFDPERINPAVTLKVLNDFPEAEPYLEEMRQAYGRDFSEAWNKKFSWGEQLALAFLDGRVAAFVWVQDGGRGAVCYYMRLGAGEYRLVTGGVLPQFRRKGVHTSRHKLVLEHLFSMGAKRVYIDAYEDNVPSWRGQYAAGFKKIGRIHVLTLFGKTFIRWL